MLLSPVTPISCKISYSSKQHADLPFGECHCCVMISHSSIAIVVVFAVIFLTSYFQLQVHSEDDIDDVTIICPKRHYLVPHSKKSFQINAAQPDSNNNKLFTYRYKYTIDKITGKSLSDHVMFSGERSSILTMENWHMSLEAVGEIEINLKITAKHLKTRDSESIQCSIVTEIFHQPILGIDLGTTYSCVAYQLPCTFETKTKNNRKIETNKLKTNFVKTSNKEYCMPTAIYFPPNSKNTNKVIIGEDALKHLQYETEKSNVIYDIKRIIGRSKDDPEVDIFKKNHAFKLSTSGDHFEIEIPNRDNEKITPEQALAIILQHLVISASKEIGVRYIQDAVVSIPAYFHDGQRRGIRSACEIASLIDPTLVVEPSSAAIAYKYHYAPMNANFKTFITFDFGGGTLDVTLMNCAGVQCIVKSVEGNSTLGGINFDYVIIDMIAKELKKDLNAMTVKEKQRFQAEYTVAAQDSMLYSLLFVFFMIIFRPLNKKKKQKQKKNNYKNKSRKHFTELDKQEKNINILVFLTLSLKKVILRIINKQKN